VNSADPAINQAPTVDKIERISQSKKATT